MSCYIVQETDGSSRFSLEDLSGFLVLEDCIPTAAGQSVMGGTPEALAAIEAAAARLNAQRGEQATLKRRRLEQDDEDWLSILLNGL